MRCQRLHLGCILHFPQSELPKVERRLSPLAPRRKHLARNRIRASPERKRTSGCAFVEIGGNLESIISIVNCVLYALAEIIPGRTPWCSAEAQSLCPTAGISVWEVKTDQDTLICFNVSQQCRQNLFASLCSSRWIVEIA